MKTKEQKRLEAILRLEREPRNPRLTDEQRRETWVRRKLEALRVRAAFGERRFPVSEVVNDAKI